MAAIRRFQSYISARPLRAPHDETTSNDTFACMNPGRDRGCRRDARPEWRSEGRWQWRPGAPEESANLLVSRVERDRDRRLHDLPREQRGHRVDRAIDRLTPAVIDTFETPPTAVARSALPVSTSTAPRQRGLRTAVRASKLIGRARSYAALVPCGSRDLTPPVQLSSALLRPGFEPPAPRRVRAARTGHTGNRTPPSAPQWPWPSSSCVRVVTSVALFTCAPDRTPRSRRRPSARLGAVGGPSGSPNMGDSDSARRNWSAARRETI